jgi:hypothetical protein
VHVLHVSPQISRRGDGRRRGNGSRRQPGAAHATTAKVIGTTGAGATVECVMRRSKQLSAMPKDIHNPKSRRCMMACMLFVLAVFAIPAAAQNQPAPPGSTPTQRDVTVALVLAVDTSGSVSNGRFELQKQGYAAAFRNPQVLNSIRSLATQAIAVTMMQWTGPSLHVVVVDWTLVNDKASAEAFAAAIEAAPRQLFGGGTSISGAIDYSRILLAGNPFRATRRVIDISGDGSNNRGRSVTQARDEAVADGIGINGLPILTVEPGLDHYYYDNVIGGPGAFMIPAENYDTFADAILKKLINEIATAGPNADHPFAAATAAQARSSRRQNLGVSVASKLSALTLAGP